MKTSAELQSAVRKYQEGDSSGFNSVYELSYPYLHTCVIHIIKDEDTAMDILQETYLEISKNISQLQDAQSFLGWAATIANRKCFAYLKKNKDILLYEDGDKEEKTDFFDDIADDEEIIPESILQNKEKQRLMKEIIDNLPDMQRLCIIGYYYNEQKQEDIAEELGIPLNTVKTYLSRAKAKIKAEVEELDVKKDTRLYALIPFFALFFDQEAQACEAAPMPKKLQQKVGKGMRRLAGEMKLKIAAAAAIVGAAAIIGAVVINNNAEKSSEKAEAQKIQTEQETEESASAQKTEETASAQETEAEQDTKEQETETEQEPATEAENIADYFEVLPISGKYDDIMYASQGLIPVSLDGKWGLVTYEDEVVVPIIYDDACPMVNEEGQSYFGDENGYYVFDRNGTELFRTEDTISSVSEGIVFTTDAYGTYRYYDLSGALIYELSGYFFAYGNYGGESCGIGFSEGCGIINNGGSLYQIDASGNLTDITVYWISESDTPSNSGIEVDGIGYSSEINTCTPISPVTEGYFIAREQIVKDYDDTFYVRSMNGSPEYEIKIRDLFTLEGTTIEGDFNSWQIPGFLKDGMIRYGYGTILNVVLTTEEGTKYYLLDLSKSGGSLGNGLLAVKDVIDLADANYWLFGEGDRWGYIDHSGNEMAVFDDACSFYNGKALIIEDGTAFAIDESFEKLGEGCTADSVHNYGEVFEIKVGEQSYLVIL